MNNKNRLIVSAKDIRAVGSTPTELAASCRNEKLTFKIYGTNCGPARHILASALFSRRHLKKLAAELSRVRLWKISIYKTRHLGVLSPGWSAQFRRKNANWLVSLGVI